jgi:hypothetical protein
LGVTKLRFAKIVFWTAGIYGLLVITPLYFLFDIIGRQDPPPITHPGFYYGFVSAAFAWQIAFCVIATNPVRFRLLMIPAILEKAPYFVAMTVLYLQRRVHPTDLGLAGIDLIFAVLFLVAFFRTKAWSTTNHRW